MGCSSLWNHLNGSPAILKYLAVAWDWLLQIHKNLFVDSWKILLLRLLLQGWDSKNLKLCHWCYSRDMASYLLATKKCFGFVLCSLRYLISYYSAISRQEELVKKKNSCEFVIPEGNTFSFILDITQICHGINVLYRWTVLVWCWAGLEKSLVKKALESSKLDSDMQPATNGKLRKKGSN